ncbi:hypothetical protein M6B38_368785 [Iris pallida]|uniref:Uncharacterized protein n=1 Tax=Iris pallida TaxID=29817 RepID=A0AAX6GGK1_IRIPA|nr:hypothetical protein M6B38_368785 [Iris pallida]
MSPFFRDKLLARVLHFFSVDRGERGSAGRGLYHERSKKVNCFKYTTWILAMQWSWTLMSIRMNQSFHRGKYCLIGKRIASYKLCLGRTCISISMKLINENEVVNGGVTIILFLVCVPKKRNLSISFFEVSNKGRRNT